MEQSKYDVFISYSRKDYVDENKNVIQGNVVSIIKDALTDAGISFWFDEEGINHGDKFAKLIVRNIKASRIFLFISTENANSSEWTGREIASAHMMKKRIIPVRVDDSAYHEDVMFYISILDYVDYKANPEKGIKDLIKAIKTYLTEEQEAERRQLIAEEERRKQEEDLIRRQRQMESLKAEIKQTENDCTQLEEQMLLKKHEYESVRANLDKKRARLDEQKNELNTILFGENKQNTATVSNSDDDFGSEISADVISWRHPIDRIKQIWNFIDYIATKRNLLTNFVFEFAFIIGAVYFIIAIVLLFDVSLESFTAGNSIVVAFFSVLYVWSVFKILMNERQGFWFCILTPFVAFPVTWIVKWHDGGFSDAFLVFISSLMASIPVLALLFLRKNKKSAWNLMTGNWKEILKWRDKISLSVCYIILFVTSICYCYVQGNKDTIVRFPGVEVEIEPVPELEQKHPLQYELDSIQKLLDEERRYISNIEGMISYKRKNQNEMSGKERFSYYNEIRSLEKDKENADGRIKTLISQYNKVYYDTISVVPAPKHTVISVRNDGIILQNSNARDSQEEMEAKKSRNYNE